MKVIVFGATGFIGSSVAEAFSRAGHITYGTSRSQSAKQSLIAQEIIPIICDPYSKEGLEAWGRIAETADAGKYAAGLRRILSGREERPLGLQLTSVIDCTSAKGAEQALSLAKHFKKIISGRPAASPKPTYIYTGGLWSWTKGPGGLDKWTDERQPRTDENSNVAWRQGVEDPVLLGEWQGPCFEDTGLTGPEESFNGVVIRPPMLYGKTGSYVGALTFQPFLDAKQGETVEVLARDVTRWQTIHRDDIGEAYRAVAEVVSEHRSLDPPHRINPVHRGRNAHDQGHLAKGQTFLPANPQTERLTDILDALVRVSGVKGYKLKDASNPFEGAWVSTLNAHPSLLTALTGWRPKRLSIVDGIDLYWAAFVASKQDKANL
jgi:nucleoside-diphosphate-sugar epimerase